jgi:hypothetical protein
VRIWAVGGRPKNSPAGRPHARSGPIPRQSRPHSPGPLSSSIEPRLDKGPTSVDEEGNAQCEHDDFATGHSVSRVKLFNEFDAKRFNVGLRRAYGRAWPAFTRNSCVLRSSSIIACMRS